MKIKDGFVLRQVMGNYVAVAVGEQSKNFRGMIKLNSTAADIWQYIEKGFSESEICDALYEKYDVDRERVTTDVKRTLELLQSQGLVEI